MEPKPLSEPLVVPPVRPSPSALLRERRTRLGLAILFVASLAVYVVTSARTVTGEDSGELIAAAYTLGVAHPPGYPLWCLLAKGMTLLPVGEAAFRVALLSALFGVLTVVALAAVVLLLTRSWPSAIAASLGFGLLRDQWSQAVIAEVYTLNSFFLASSVLILLLWAEERRWTLLYLFAFVFGLALTNHHTVLGAAPGFLLFFLIHGWRLLKDWRRILVGVGAFGLGLLPYVYLPLAASRSLDVNWGDPSGVQGTIDHVLRRQYESGDPVPAQTSGRFLEQAGVLLDHAAGQGGVLLLVLGVAGLIYLAARRFSLFSMLTPLVLLSTLGILLFTNFEPDFENSHAQRLFFVPAWLALAIAGGVVLAALLRQLPRRLTPLFTVLLVAVPVGTPLLANWKTCDYSGYRLVSDYARALLLPVAKDAILFPTSDHNTFPLLYLRYVEGLRPDVTIADKYGYVDPPFYRDAPRAAEWSRRGRTQDVRLEIESFAVATMKRPCYVTQKKSLLGHANAILETEGLWFRAWDKGRTLGERDIADREAWKRIAEIGPDRESMPYDYTSRMVMGDIKFAEARHAFEICEPKKAVESCREASSHGQLSKEVQNNLGSVLAEHQEFEEAETYFRKALALDPTYTMGRRNLATALRASGKKDEAKVEYQELLRANVVDPVANRGLAEIFRAEEAWPEAAVYLEQVGKIEGDWMAFRDAGLICLLELKAYERAKGLLRVSLAINPDQPDIREAEEHIRPVGKEDDEADERDKENRDHEDGLGQRRERESPFASPGDRKPKVKDPLEGLKPTPNLPSVPGRTGQGRQKP
jgi:tetratricopeptide (TPR) repeat protein/4-amino-4-deoxy-L-arabinose transferase-like glycosyltransferase